MAPPLQTLLDGGARPHDRDVTRTPRGGMGLVHRVTLHLDPGAQVANSAGPRAKAEPALEAWLAQRLPEPTDVACHVTWPGSSIVVTQSDLGLSAIELLHQLTLDSVDSHVELDDRLEHYVRTTAGLHPGVQLTVQYSEPVVDKVSFAQLAAWIRHLRPLLLGGRALSAVDLARPDEAGTDDLRWDLAELDARVMAATAELGGHIAAADALEADATTEPEPFIAAVSDYLLLLRRHGMRNTGTGVLRERRQRIWNDTTKMADEVVTRWQGKRDDYDAIIAGLGPLDDGIKLAELAAAEAIVSTEDYQPTSGYGCGLSGDCLRQACAV